MSMKYFGPKAQNLCLWVLGRWIPAPATHGLAGVKPSGDLIVGLLPRGKAAPVGLFTFLRVRRLPSDASAVPHSRNRTANVGVRGGKCLFLCRLGSFLWVHVSHANWGVYNDP